METKIILESTKISSASDEDNQTLIKSEKISEFKCRFCLKAMSSKLILVEHEYIHTGEKPNLCRHPGCQFRFRQKSRLSLHKRVHKIHSQENEKAGKLKDAESDGALKLPKITKLKFFSVIPNVFTMITEYKKKKL